jgi:hypothetical protein
MKPSLAWGALAVSALLAGCVMMPTAPTIAALPGSQKNYDQFNTDQADCRGFAQNTVAGPGQAAAGNTAANAAVSTAVGAAAGALIGSVSGQAGQGAAIGAGTGLLFGSMAGSNYAGYSSYQLQYQYDRAYLQCMYDRGNRVPSRFAYGMAERQAAPPPYPPREYPPPAGAPPGAPSSYPPPNTPPPRG